LFAEHDPETPTERILVEQMAQHIWLSRRAQDLQGGVIENQANLTEVEIGRRFSLFLRYQTTNDRGFHKCLDQLAKLRAEKRKAEIGFERQKERNRAREQAEARAEALQNRERRRAERHEYDLMLAQAKAEHQGLINMMLGHDHHELRPLSSAAMDRSIAVATGKAA
jgi:hypothetical protein